MKPQESVKGKGVEKFEKAKFEIIPNKSICKIMGSSSCKSMEKNIFYRTQLDLQGAPTDLYHSDMEHFKAMGRQSLWTGTNQNFTSFNSLTANKAAPSTKQEFAKGKTNKQTNKPNTYTHKEK